MSDEGKQRSKDFFWFFTAAVTLIFVFGSSIALMNFFAKIVPWSGTLGHIANFWDSNLAEPFENLLGPFAKWIGWRPDWIANYLVFGFFFYSLMLCVSKLQSKWEKGDWISLATTWPLGVLAWPGMITLLVKTLINDFDQLSYVLIVFSPFLIFVTLFIANFWV